MNSTKYALLHAATSIISILFATIQHNQNYVYHIDAINSSTAAAIASDFLSASSKDSPTTP